MVARESETKERFSSTAIVIVNVQDENDNDPSFDFDKYTAEVGENAVGGTKVITITAKDADQNGQDPLRYQLIGQHGGLFAINEATGEITTTDSCLDYEEYPRSPFNSQKGS